MSKDITIIYVIYKSGDIFFDNIKLLKNFKKIIIDNDPRSNLEEKIKKIDNNVDYTKLQKNIGMAKAANLAFEKVKTKFFLYITADTIIDEKNILYLRDIFYKYKNVGLACPLHLNQDNNYKGNYFCHPVKRLAKRNNYEKYIYKSLSKLEPKGDFFVESVWGAPIMLLKDTVKKIGFFDSNFFMYFEDVDLCDRLKANGLSIIETPSAYCNHIIEVKKLKSISNHYTTTTSFKFSELYYFSKYDPKYVYRIYIHSFDFFVRIFINLVLFRKYKTFSNIFKLIGILRYIFFKLKKYNKN